MEQTKYDVFISYRHKGGSVKAQLVKSELKQRGVKEECIFLDTHSLHDGDFEQKIKVAIEQSQCVVVIISKGCFDEIKDTDFWYMEIKEAFQQSKKVVPIFFDNILSFTDIVVPKELEKLKKMNGVIYQHEYADMVFDRLLTFIGFQPQIQQYREKKGCLINLKYKGCLISLTLIALLCIVVVPITFLVRTAMHYECPDDDNAYYSPAHREYLSSKPKSSALFFDTSGRMCGYVEAHDPRFWNIISVFVNLSDSNIVHLNGKVMSPEDLDQMITQKRIGWSSQYELKNYIHSMTALINDSNDVSILVTDGILKGSYGKIYLNPHYNQSHRVMLSKEISSMLRRTNHDICALVVRYKANFNGYYYCYDNRRVILSNVDRPFFVIVLGKWHHIYFIEKNLKEMDNVNNDECSYTDYVIIGDHSIFGNIQLRGIEGLIYNNNRMIIDKEYETKSVAFEVDLSELPEHIWKEDFLRDNIILSILNDDSSEKFLDKDSYTFIIKDSKLILRIKAKELKNRTLSFKLKWGLPMWVETKSTDDDTDIETNTKTQDKTFNLKYMIDGFTSLQDSPYIINQTIDFK